MAEENKTIARPYARAIYDLADREDSFDRWSEMLDLLATIISDARTTEIVGNPNLGKENAQRLILDVAGDRLTEEGKNLVRLLIANDRHKVLPEIAARFNQLKSEREGILEVEIISAYDIDAAQQQQLADALKRKLGREVKIGKEKDPSLLGGIKIRAGDLVIDGSVKHKIARLATDLGI